jgi:hypothetical protein|tara:strand:+ start:132 stop:353 length:222 start_codon:yes stop_codon:yes gene_type:complete
MSNKEFHNLTTSDQMVYFDWMNALVEDGQIDPNISNDDYIDKMERMHKCDMNQTEPSWPFFDGNNYLKDEDLE